MSLADYTETIEAAHRLGVIQVALGGGNPNQHPAFCEILRITKETYGIVPNYTTNGRGLTDPVISATKRFCGAVAVSAYPPYIDTANAVDTLTSEGIRTNIHFVLTSRTIATAMEWLEEPPRFLRAINAIIFLNFKPIGRSTDRALLLRNSPILPEFLALAATRTHGARIGFDSCMVSAIAADGQVPTFSYDGCEAARFSLFVSEEAKMYPCSFMGSAGYPGRELRECSMLEFWRSDELMNRMREGLRTTVSCGPCSMVSVCHGGCPVFPIINLCNREVQHGQRS